MVTFRFPQHQEMMCILPSTVKIADLFIAPSTFLATHVYTPASMRLTPRTSSLPSDWYWKWPVQFLSNRNHITLGFGFPEAEHRKIAVWFSLKVCVIGEITTVGAEIDSPASPFAPGYPLGPGTPFSPCAPFWPGGPMIPWLPWGPGSPVNPRDPFRPVFPRGPLLPRDPFEPGIPAGPRTHICSLDEQNASGLREEMVLFISFLIASIIRFWLSGVPPENRRVLNFAFLSVNRKCQLVNQNIGPVGGGGYLR